MRWRGSIIAAVMVVGIAGPSSAGDVRLAIRGGLVTLDAKDATLREIFAEWSRVGQTRVVNAERLSGGQVTLQLTDVPERQALETLLRSAAGFIAAPRPMPESSLSTYDRIVLMPGARPTVVPTVGAPAPSAQPSPGRDRVAVSPVLVSDDEDQTDQDQAMPVSSPFGGQRPGMPAGNPYAPSSGQAGAAQAQPAPPSSSQRPGMPTAPPQPIK